MCVCTCIYTTYVWVPVVSKKKKKKRKKEKKGALDSLGLELQVVDYTTLVLGTRLKSSGRAASRFTSEPSLQSHINV